MTKPTPPTPPADRLVLQGPSKLTVLAIVAVILSVILFSVVSFKATIYDGEKAHQERIKAEDAAKVQWLKEHHCYQSRVVASGGLNSRLVRLYACQDRMGEYLWEDIPDGQ